MSSCKRLPSWVLQLYQFTSISCKSCHPSLSTSFRSSYHTPLTTFSMLLQNCSHACCTTQSAYRYVLTHHSLSISSSAGAFASMTAMQSATDLPAAIAFVSSACVWEWRRSRVVTFRTAQRICPAAFFSVNCRHARNPCQSIRTATGSFVVKGKGSSVPFDGLHGGTTMSGTMGYT